MTKAAHVPTLGGWKGTWASALTLSRQQAQGAQRETTAVGHQETRCTENGALSVHPESYDLLICHPGGLLGPPNLDHPSLRNKASAGELTHSHHEL